MTAGELVAQAQAVVFDLDGTLADTAQDLWWALTEALQAHGLGAVGMGLVLRTLHGGLEATARAALAELGATDVGLDGFCADYAASYRRRDHRATRLYDGAAALLGVLASRGVGVGVCTNKEQAEAQRLLSRLGVARHIACVAGPDTTGFAKPDPRPLLHALACLGQSPADAVFIGDSEVDARCAAAAGVPFVLHAAGFGAAALSGQAVPAFRRYVQLLAPLSQS